MGINILKTMWYFHSAFLQPFSGWVHMQNLTPDGKRRAGDTVVKPPSGLLVHCYEEVPWAKSKVNHAGFTVYCHQAV
jgi:hypothetical protein